MQASILTLVFRRNKNGVSLQPSTVSLITVIRQGVTQNGKTGEPRADPSSNGFTQLSFLLGREGGLSFGFDTI